MELNPQRRRFLVQAGAALGVARVSSGAETAMLAENGKGHYRFLPGTATYSSAAVAMAGHEVVHATFAAAPPYQRAFLEIDRHLQRQKLPPQALCGIELRTPQPYSFDGFGQFNEGYVGLLKERSLLVAGQNPVARTNVCSEVDPPSQVLLYGFSYVAPSQARARTFVIAGAGELTAGGSGPSAIVRRGDVSEAGLREKAAHVLNIMDERLKAIEAGWPQVITIEIYTVHNIFPLMKNLLLPRMGAAKMHGVRWHFARPPIEEIEFEMDMRGCAREIVL